MILNLLFSHDRLYDLALADVTKRFILVANTSDASLEILKNEVETTQYALLHAKDGKAAIAYVELLKPNIDLAIIDLELPLVSGLDVIWHLVRQKRPKPMKIIATSAADVPLLDAPLKEFGVETVLGTPLAAEDWRKLIITFLHGEHSDDS